MDALPPHGPWIGAAVFSIAWGPSTAFFWQFLTFTVYHLMMFKDMIITVSKVSGEILQGAEELQWRLRASLMPASCLVHGFFDLITSCSVPPDEDQCARNTCEWFDDFNRHVCSLRSAYETRTCTSNLWQPSSWYKQRSLGILRCS